MCIGSAKATIRLLQVQYASSAKFELLKGVTDGIPVGMSLDFHRDRERDADFSAQRSMRSDRKKIALSWRK